MRRVVGRDVGYGKWINMKRGFMYEVVRVVGEMMAALYGEVKEKGEFMGKVMKTEEEGLDERL